MVLHIYTIVHRLISLIAIFTGLIVLFGMLGGKRLDCWTKWFLITTVATSSGIFLSVSWIHAGDWRRGHVVDRIGDCDLRTLLARSRGALAWIYVVTAVIALCFNVFVLIVQSFEKVPALHVLAPTQTEPPFKITQLAVLALFVVLGIAAAIDSATGRFVRLTSERY
jgi:hypothetical protein